MADMNFSASELIKKGTSKLPGDQKFGRIASGIMILCLVLFAAHFAAPYFEDLKNIVWDTMTMVIAGAIGLGLLIFISANARNFVHLCDAISRKLFFWIITYDPFMIQEKQIQRAEEDVVKMIEEKEKIRGKYDELQTKVKNNRDQFESAQAGFKVAKDKFDRTTNEEEKKIHQLSMDDMMRKQARCKQYVDKIGPIVSNMEFMIKFITEGGRIIQNKIKNAKADLIQNKDIFESAQFGAAALDRMKKAMIGDVQLNNEAEIAMAEAMKQTAMLNGQIMTSMEIIAEATRSANLEEAGNLEVARKKLESLNLLDSPMSIPTSNSFNNVASFKTIDYSSNLPE